MTKAQRIIEDHAKLESLKAQYRRGAKQQLRLYKEQERLLDRITTAKECTVINGKPFRLQSLDRNRPGLETMIGPRRIADIYPNANDSGWWGLNWGGPTYRDRRCIPQYARSKRKAWQAVVTYVTTGKLPKA